MCPDMGSACYSCLLAVIFSALLSTFNITYIIIFVNFRKKGENDMAVLSVRVHIDRHVGKGKEQDYE